MVNIFEVSALHLRDQLLALEPDFNRLVGVDTKLSLSMSRPMTDLQDYYLHYYMAQQVAGLHYRDSNERLSKTATDNGYLIMPMICQQDTERICLPYAVCAWLSIDNFRWPDPAPEDLSYGMVLQAPTYVLHFARYLLGYDRDIYNKLVSKKDLTSIYNLATRIAQQNSARRLV